MITQRLNDRPTRAGEVPGRGQRWARWLVSTLAVAVAGTALVYTTLAELPAQAAHALQSTVATQPPRTILIGSSTSGKVPVVPDDLALIAAGDDDSPKISFADEDILAFAPAGNDEEGTFSLFFDGSQYGLSKADLQDFEYLVDEDTLLFTLDKSLKIPNPNAADEEEDPLSVTDKDVIAFNRTTNIFSIYLVGEEIGLTKSGEDIDALAILPGPDDDVSTDDLLLISTIGSAEVNGPGGTTVKARDEDLLACDLVDKSCTLFFDGSDLDLGGDSEDVEAAWLDPDNPQNLYLATVGSFTPADSQDNEIKGNKQTTFGCSLVSPEPESDCVLFIFFNFKDVEFKNNLDGLWVSFAGLPDSVGAALADPVVETESLADDAAEFHAAVAENDPDIVYQDFFEETLFLPMIAQESRE